MKAPIIFTAWGLLLAPLASAESAPQDLADQLTQEPENSAPAVPEPSPLLFAGLGGLVLLMCAVRRK